MSPDAFSHRHGNGRASMTWPDGRMSDHGSRSGSSMSFAPCISARSVATGILAGCCATQPSPEGDLMGIDLSTRMLELARGKSADEGLDNVTFVRGDAQVFPFEPDVLDIAMSSFGTMFFNDPVAAYTHIGSGLRPSGTIALLAWRTLQENEWLMSLRSALAIGRELPMPPPDAPTPFALANPERVRSILGSAGLPASNSNRSTK